MFILIGFICFFMQNSYASKIFDCSNGTVYLKYNELAFYESSNFPWMMNANETNTCNLTFVLADFATNSSKMYTIFLGFAPTIYYAFLTKNDTYLNMKKMINIYKNLKGIIIFVEDDERCPLESISRKNPFKISNENEVVHIKSNYYFYKSRKYSCRWRFEAADGYEFKIVIRTLFISSQTLLRIKNSTDLIVNERSVNTYHPYYNNDTYVEIYLSKGDPNYVVDALELEAYISILKKEQKNLETNCTVIKNDNIITWTNIDANKNEGYANNIQCSYDVIVPKHYVVEVNINALNVEEYVDVISSSVDDVTDIFVSSREPFIIEPYKNGTEKRVSWKFVSDGSVNYMGFEIEFKFHFCQCGNKIARCNSTNNVLMNYTNDGSYYCGNLKCNVTIEQCPSKLTYMEIYFSWSRGPNNIFQIISNNQTFLDMNRKEQKIFKIFLNSMNLNIFQAITFSSSSFFTLKFNVKSMGDPEYGTKIVLSSDKTTAIANTPFNVITLVEMAPSMIDQNVYYILHCYQTESIMLYDTNLTATVKNCFTDNSPYQCIIKEPSFVLYQMNMAVSAIKLSSDWKNCVFQNNIFMHKTVDVRLPIPISAISSKDGECLITVLLDDYGYFFSHLWTTSKTENVKVYIGLDQTKLYFKFNSNTVKKWKDITLLSPVYTILVPTSEAVYIILTVNDNYDSMISPFPYQSFVTTIWYGCFKSPRSEDSNIFLYQIKENPIKFTVLDYNFYEGNIVYFYDSENQNVLFVFKEIGDFVIFKNISVTLNYQDKNGKSENGALLFIETYNLYDEIY